MGDRVTDADDMMARMREYVRVLRPTPSRELRIETSAFGQRWLAAQFERAPGGVVRADPIGDLSGIPVVVVPTLHHRVALRIVDGQGNLVREFVWAETDDPLTLGVKQSDT
jgi:2-phospho-L-lactate transferase/gluconeogenesis factor (CofD/UPF0052 family)